MIIDEITKEIFVRCLSCMGIAQLCGGCKWGVVVKIIMLCRSEVGIVVVIAWSWLGLLQVYKPGELGWTHAGESVDTDLSGRACGTITIMYYL